MADTELPVLFLDVDGTASPMWRGDPNITYGCVTARFPNILFDPAIIATLNQMAADGLLEIRWLTDWEEAAATSFAPAVGLPDFPAYRMRDAHQDPKAPDRDWYKEQVIRDFCATTDRRFIWADDNIDSHGTEHDANADLAIERDYPGRGLFICPDANFGLRAADMERVAQFVQQPQEAPETSTH